VDLDRLRPLRRSGDEPRDDGGVRDGVRDESLARLALGDAASISGSSSYVSVGIRLSRVILKAIGEEVLLTYQQTLPRW
jgi:hypothetical protein